MPRFMYRLAPFWRRCAAAIVDAVVLFAIQWTGLTQGANWLDQFIDKNLDDDPAMNLLFLLCQGMLASIPLIVLFCILVPWLYFALSESSNGQASPGKRLFGLRVISKYNCRPTFTRVSIKVALQSAVWLILSLTLQGGWLPTGDLEGNLLISFFALPDIATHNFSPQAAMPLLIAYMICFVSAPLTKYRQSLFDHLSGCITVRVR